MTHDSRQHRHPCGDIGAVAVPVGEGGDREGVPDVMHPRGASASSADAGVYQQLSEYRIDTADGQAGPRGGEEEAGGDWGRAQLPAALPVLPQHQDGGGVQRRPPGPVVLAADGHEPRVQVDIACVQGDRLTRPHAGGEQQADQCLMRGGLQRIGQRARRVDERSDLLGRIQIRCRAAGCGSEQTRWRDLAGRVEGRQVAGETPRRRQSLAPVCRREPAGAVAHAVAVSMVMVRWPWSSR